MVEERLYFCEHTPKEQYAELLNKSVGYIFRVKDSDHETVLMRLRELTPDWLDFEVFPINPGTDQYTLVGPGHLMVTKRAVIVANAPVNHRVTL